jgi:hypothetical protein
MVILHTDTGAVAETVATAGHTLPQVMAADTAEARIPLVAAVAGTAATAGHTTLPQVMVADAAEARMPL